MAPFSKTLQMIGPCSLFFFSFLRRSPLKKATAENKLAQGNVILFLKDCILPGSFSTREEIQYTILSLKFLILL